MQIVYQTANANTPSITSISNSDNVTLLAANPDRKGWLINNTSGGASTPIYILLGSGATSSVFHFALKKGTSAGDGLGGSVSQMDGTVYTGIITASGGASSRCVAVEQ